MLIRSHDYEQENGIISIQQHLQEPTRQHRSYMEGEDPDFYPVDNLSHPHYDPMSATATITRLRPAITSLIRSEVSGEAANTAKPEDGSTANRTNGTMRYTVQL
jgi:hypothetical protein